MLKVISGGQTGVDRMGLEVAKSLELETGGTAPKNYWTENGSDYSLKEFGLIESKEIGYKDRTIRNIQDSDGTLVFGNHNSSGSRLTIDITMSMKIPLGVNYNPQEIFNFIILNNIQVLNIASNRASKIYPEILTTFRSYLLEGLQLYLEWYEKRK